MGRISTNQHSSFIYLYIHTHTDRYILLQLCPTLCDPIVYSLPGFSVYGILQARILEWVTISYSRRYMCIYIYIYIDTDIDIDGNTRPPDLPLEKPVCRSGSNS